jgi:hypothetical protein
MSSLAAWLPTQSTVLASTPPQGLIRIRYLLSYLVHGVHELTEQDLTMFYVPVEIMAICVHQVALFYHVNILRTSSIILISSDSADSQRCCFFTLLELLNPFHTVRCN